jgi:hypothetical protein
MKDSDLVTAAPLAAGAPAGPTASAQPLSILATMGIRLAADSQLPDDVNHFNVERAPRVTSVSFKCAGMRYLATTRK